MYASEAHAIITFKIILLRYMLPKSGDKKEIIFTEVSSDKLLLWKFDCTNESRGVLY